MIYILIVFLVMFAFVYIYTLLEANRSLQISSIARFGEQTGSFATLPLLQSGGKKRRNRSKQSNKVDIDLGGKKGKPSLISGVKFSSNNDKINLNEKYSSKFAPLSSKQSWAGNPQSRYLSYLEATLPGYYHIDGIITRGRSGAREWVTRFYVEYWDRYSDNWVKYPQIMTGNRNDNSSITNQVDISTNKLRIYPIKWHKHPSLRIGFIGNKTSFSSCRYYRMKMKTGNAMDRRNYQQLYQKKCLKVPKETFDLVVNNLRKNKKKMCLNKKRMSELEKRQAELERLKRHCCTVAKELKRLKSSCCPREQLIDLAKRYRAIVEPKVALLQKQKANS